MRRSPSGARATPRSGRFRKRDYIRVGECRPTSTVDALDNVSRRLDGTRIATRDHLRQIGIAGSAMVEHRASEKECAWARPPRERAACPS